MISEIIRVTLLSVALVVLLFFTVREFARLFRNNGIDKED